MAQAIHVGIYGQRASKPELGQFAAEIFKALDTDGDFSVSKLDAVSSDELDIVVYASRSDAKLAEAIALCDRLAIPLIIVSTSLETSVSQIPHSCSIQFVPNTSKDVVDYMQLVKTFAQEHPGWTLSMVEYHQSTKQDVSGTALAIIQSIGANPSVITTVRDDVRAQHDLELPDSALKSYAAHQTTFTDPSGTVTQAYNILVIGRNSYTSGLKQLLKDTTA